MTSKHYAATCILLSWMDISLVCAALTDQCFLICVPIQKWWSGLDANIFLWYNINCRVRSTLHGYQIQFNIYLFTYYRRSAANTETKVRLVITYIYGRQGYYTLLRFVAVCNCRPFCFAWLCCKVTVKICNYRAIFALLPTQSGKQPRAARKPPHRRFVCVCERDARTPISLPFDLKESNERRKKAVHFGVKSVGDFRKQA